jgi:hypothetical protein
MYLLLRLVDLPIEKRIDEFIKLIKFHEDNLKKDEKNVDEFALVYPEWALGFSYVEDLKKAIKEGKL